MNNKVKKLIALLMTLFMAFDIAPMSVLADTSEAPQGEQYIVVPETTTEDQTDAAAGRQLIVDGTAGQLGIVLIDNENEDEQPAGDKVDGILSLTGEQVTVKPLSSDETADLVAQFLTAPALRTTMSTRSVDGENDGRTDDDEEKERSETYIGYAAFEISPVGIPEADGYSVSVSLDGNPVNMLGNIEGDIDPESIVYSYELYHIHDGEKKELKQFSVEEANGVINAFSFTTTDGFSPFILKYTVEFHYKGEEAVISGGSQILLSDLITQLNIMNGDALLNVADVASVTFTNNHLVTVDQVSGEVEYFNGEEKITKDVGDKDFLLTSEEPFTSEEQLTIWLTNGEPIVVGVTDAQTLYVHLYGQDTMTMQQMLGSDFKSDFAFYYAEPDTVSVSSDLYNLSNLSSIPYGTSGSVWVYDWDENVKDWVYKAILIQDCVYEVTKTETITLSDMMASLGVTISSGTIAVLSSDSAPGIYVNNGNEFSIETTTFPEGGIVYDLFDFDTSKYLPYCLVIKGSSAVADKDDGVFTYAIVDGAAEITGLVDEENFDPSADPDNYTIPAKTMLDDTEYDVVAIQRDAFQNEDRIKTLALADSETVLRLDLECLSGIPNVTSITGGRPVKFNTIGGVVINDNNLTTLKLNIQGRLTYTETPISNNAALTDVELTCSGSSALGSNFLMNCGAVKKLTYHGSADIGNGAMKHLSNLEMVVIDNADGYAVRIDDEAFREMAALKSVEFTGAIRGIGWCAFYNDQALETFTVRSTGTSPVNISDWAFTNCSALTGFDIGDTPVSSIGYRSFSANTALSTFKAGTYADDSINIGGYAFYSTPALKTFSLGDTAIKSFGNNAFDNSALVGDLTFKTDNATIGSRAFFHMVNLTGLTFDGDVASFAGQALGSWGENDKNPEVTKVIVTGKTGTVSGSSFYGMPKLTAVVFKGGVDTFETEVFGGGTMEPSTASKTFVYVGNNGGTTTLGEYIVWANRTDTVHMYFNLPSRNVNDEKGALPNHVSAYFTDGMLSDLYVNPDYIGGDSDGTEEKPFTSIQAALDFVGSFADLKTKFKSDASAAGVGSLNLPFNGGAAGDGITLHITTTSSDSVKIPAGVLAGSDILEGIVFENGAATQINIEAGALKNCAALASVEVKNTDAKVAIGKGAFEGCDKLNSVCEAEQTVESDAGKVTLAKSTNAMIGTMLVKTPTETEDATIKAKIETDCADFTTPTVEYYDLRLEDIHGEVVTGKAADVVMTADIPATAWHIYIYHNTGSNVESFRITEDNSTTTADKLTEVCFYVDSFSPFATAYCPGTPYHDDMFWYELSRDEEDNVTGAVIIGIYDGTAEDGTEAYTGTTLEFSGKTRDEKAFPVTAIQTEAFKNNTNITTAVFTNENELGVGEDAFSGCTTLANVIIDGKLGLVDADLFDNATTVALINSPDSLPEGALAGDKLETIYFGSAIGEGVAPAIAGVSKGKTVYINANKDDCTGATKLDELLAANEGNAPEVFFLNSTEEKGDLFVAGTPVTPEVKDETTGAVISGPDGSKTAPFNTFAQLSEFMGGKGGKDGADEEVVAPEIASKLQPILTAANVNHTVPETFKKTLTGSYTVYVLNTVSITANEAWDSDAEDPIVLNRYPEFKGVMVQNDTGLSLRNVVLDGGSEAGVAATAPIINSKANLDIHEGAVIRNNNRTSYGYPDGAGGIYASGHVTMDGGEISGNTGMYGGGIQICGSGSVFDMSGGVIRNNTANHQKAYGGGVNVSSGATMNLSGGEIKNNVATGSNNAVGGAGGGIALGADVSGMCQNSRLVMTGGTIDGNESAQSGGGLFIQTNCTANITAGNITNNTAHGGDYGGGGIYANGVRDDTEDGRLYLSNVLITDNSANETGGGYAGCCTSTAYIYMGNGAALYGNSAGDNSDFHVGTEYHVTSWGMQSGTPYAFVSQYMFNGTEYHWKNVETGEDMTPAELARISTSTSMRAYPDGSQPTTAAVIITGNHSDTKAGGVGSNGFVSIGDVPEPNDVKWTPTASKIIHGRDMKEGETFTFTVYEEKTSQGLNFWWTRYNDVQVGTGTVTGGKNGEPATIVFDEIDLGQQSSENVGEVRTFLVVEDAKDDGLLHPDYYLAFTVIIGETLNKETNKIEYCAELKSIERGRIIDGEYEYENTLSGTVSERANATENFGRIRMKAEDTTFVNTEEYTVVKVVKTWKDVNGDPIDFNDLPENATVTFQLYADGQTTVRKQGYTNPINLEPITLDGDWDYDGEPEPWVAVWDYPSLPIYRLDNNGQMYHTAESGDDFDRIVYTVMEIQNSTEMEFAPASPNIELTYKEDSYYKTGSSETEKGFMFSGEAVNGQGGLEISKVVKVSKDGETVEADSEEIKNKPFFVEVSTVIGGTTYYVELKEGKPSLTETAPTGDARLKVSMKKPLTLSPLPCGEYTVEEISTDDELAIGGLGYVTADSTMGATVTVKAGETARAGLENVYGNGRYCVAVTKEWDDDNNRDGMRPTVIYAELYRDRVLQEDIDGDKDYVTLNAANNWTAMVRGVELFNPADGSYHQYTWKEFVFDTDGTTRIYVGDNNKITFTVDGRSAEYIAENRGVDSVNNYPELGEITFITKLINRYTPERINVIATKVWDKEENFTGLRTDVTLRLEGSYVADGETYYITDSGLYAPEQTIAVNAESTQAKWEKLPRYVDGHEITYKVVEVNVPAGYEATYSNEGKVKLNTETGVYEVTVTNTLQKGSLEITKRMFLNDDEVKADSAKDTVKAVYTAQKDKKFYVRVYTQIGDTTWYVTNDNGILSKVDTEAEKFEVTLAKGVTINNLPAGTYIIEEFDEDNNAIGSMTFVKELSKMKDEAQVVKGEKASAEIINKYTSGRYCIAVTKQWIENGQAYVDDDLTLEVTLTRSVNGVKDDFFSKKYTLNKANNWSTVAVGMEQMDASGNRYTYTWTEGEHSGWVEGEQTSILKNDDIESMIFLTMLTNSRVDARIPVKKIVSGDPYEGKFTISMEFVSAKDSDDADITALPKIPEAIQLGNGEEGAFVLKGFTVPGTYKYTLKETNTSIPGVTYDADKTVTITVEWNEDKTFLVATADPADEIVFNNKHGAVGFEPKAIKELTGANAPADAQFTFELKNNAGTVIDTQTVKAGETAVFDELIYNTAGTYKYTITEKAPDQKLAGITYSDEEIKLTVIVTEVEATGALVVSHQYENNDNTITNTYMAAGSIVIPAKKTLAGRDLTETDVFTFTLTGEGQNQSKQNNGADVTFDAITYTQADIGKTFIYTVKETKGAQGGIGYDASEYMVRVTVSASDQDEDQDGKADLVITKQIIKTKNENGVAWFRTVDEIEFANTYEAAGSVTFKGNKSIDNRDLTGDEVFTFEIKEGETVIATASNNAAGAIAYPTINYTLDDVGTHTYTVKESSADGNGITVDTKEYTVVVKVSDNKDGTLKVEASDNSQALNFVNHYEATGSITFKGAKSIDTRDLTGDDVFTFEIKEGETVIATVQNDATGAIAYPAIEYVLNSTQNDLGEHTYTVKEISSNGKGITVATNTYTVKVTVTDNKDGTLTATSSDAYEALNFVNHYEATGSITFKGNKRIDTRDLTENDVFTFEIKEDDTVIATAKNDATGAIAYPKIEYTLDDVGTHIYMVKETSANGSGITVDTKEYTVVVKVSDNKDGTLKVEASYNNQALNFENHYEATGSVTFEGGKTIKGRPLTAEDQFTFQVTENGTVVATGANNGTETITFTEISYTLDDVGTHTYTVKETSADGNGITVDTNEYTVTVTVSDNKDGTLKVEPSDNYKALNFVNTYDANGEAILKGVKTIEGREFKNGDSITIKLEALTDGAPMPEEDTVTIKPVAGNTAQYAFKPIRYKLSDIPAGQSDITFQYKVTESKFTMDGVAEADTTEYTVSVKLSDNGDGTLLVQKSNSCEHLDFTNVYAAKVEVSPHATKRLVGSGSNALRANQFTFSITPDATNPKTGIDQSKLKTTATNAANGSIDFGTLSFTKEGTWIYTVRETSTSTNTITVDHAIYTVAYTVKDVNHNGTLTVEQKITKVDNGATTTEDAIVFINTTMSTPTPTPTSTPTRTPAPPPRQTPIPTQTPAPETTEVSGHKAWEDNNNEDGMRPDSITVNLMADGAAVDSTTASAATGWSWSFTNLPKYDGERLISYTIAEVSVPYYTTTVSGFDLINTYTRETTSATITKIWDDNDNERGLRPSSIQVTLSNGMTVTLSDANGWSATINNLPVYKNGVKVTYTWSEPVVLGYTQTNVAVSGTTTLITNSTRKPDEPGNPTPHNPWITPPDESKRKKHGKALEIIDDYETPLGLGIIINHVGDCYE